MRACALASALEIISGSAADRLGAFRSARERARAQRGRQKPCAPPPQRDARMLPMFAPASAPDAPSCPLITTFGLLLWRDAGIKGIHLSA